MASLAAATKRTKREDIKKGTIFYVKWDMEDGSSKYFKAIATGENKGGKFEIRYTQDGSTEMRKRSTIDDRSKTFISKEAYDNTISAYPPKKPSVGEEHQVVELPQVGTDTSEHRALSMIPLTARDIQIMSATPLTNEDARKDMDRAGRSKEGWGRKTRRRRKKKRRKSRKKRNSRRKKRKTKKRKMRRNKKTRKRKQKGRGANICSMISDPDKKNELKVMAISRAKRARRLQRALHPETGKPLASMLSMLEAHNYCQEMNNDNYMCDAGNGMCRLMDSEAGKKILNEMLSERGFK
jgi:hypothetical protein